MIPKLESDTPYSSRGMHACSESHTIEIFMETYRTVSYQKTTPKTE